MAAPLDKQIVCPVLLGRADKLRATAPAEQGREADVWDRFALNLDAVWSPVERPA